MKSLLQKTIFKKSLLQKTIFFKDTLPHKIQITLNYYIEQSHIIKTATIVFTLQEISLAGHHGIWAIISSTKTWCAYKHNFWGRFYFSFNLVSILWGRFL